MAVSVGTSEDPFVLRVENLTKRYGSLVALRDVSLAVRRGAIHGLLGENGAGKARWCRSFPGSGNPPAEPSASMASP